MAELQPDLPAYALTRINSRHSWLPVSRSTRIRIVEHSSGRH